MPVVHLSGLKDQGLASAGLMVYGLCIFKA